MPKQSGDDQLTVWGSTQIPYSQEAEEATVGAVLVDPKISLVLSFLHADDFFILRHNYIWKAVERLNERQEIVDYLTVIQELTNFGQLAEIGGPAYLTQLINNTPTSAHAEAYGRIVQRAAVRRRLMSAADQIKGFALREDLTVEQVLAEVDRRVADIHEVELTRSQRDLQTIIAQTFDFVTDRMKDPTILPGIPWGFRDVDKLTLGAEKQNLIIIAAVAGMGKTSLMGTGALNMAAAGKRVMFQSYEMSDNDLASRFLSLESGINLLKLRSGALNQSEFERFAEVANRMMKLSNRLFLSDVPATLEMLRSKALRQMMETGLDALFVDYLQIITPNGRFGPNQRTAEVTHFAYGLKQLAQELNIPVIAAAQLNREVGDKPPKLDQLRESGAIEQAADKVIFIHRDEYYNPETEFPNEADIIIAKHRNGPTGTVKMYFEKTTTKFLNGVERNIDLKQLGTGAPKTEKKPQSKRNDYKSKRHTNPFSRAPKAESKEEEAGEIMN